MKRWILPWGWLMLLLGCNPSRENIKLYFYPLPELVNGGQVYVYQPVLVTGTQQDTLPMVYAKHEYFPRDTAAMLVTTTFESDCRQSGIYRGEVVGNGVIESAVQLMAYATDSAQQPVVTQAEVRTGNYFLFQVQDSSRILYDIAWHSPLDSSEYNQLRRVRHYEGHQTHEYQGRAYDCVVWRATNEVVSQHPLKGDARQSFERVEYFAKRLGLVYYEIRVGTQTMRYTLQEVITMEELLERCKPMMQWD